MIAFNSASVNDWLFFSWIGGKLYWVGWLTWWWGGGRNISASMLLVSLLLLCEEEGEGKGGGWDAWTPIRKELVLCGDFGGICAKLWLKHRFEVVVNGWVLVEVTTG